MTATKNEESLSSYGIKISIHPEVLLDVLIIQYVAVCGKQFGPQEGSYIKNIVFFRLKFNL